jgi:type I restriction enzyme S subunit
MGQSPPSASCSETGDGLPFIQGNAEFGARYPIPRLRCSAPARIAEVGDLLLSVRAPVGELNQARERTVIGRGLAALRFPANDRDYAWHAVKWATYQLGRVAQGSTFVAVSRKDVERLAIPWHGELNLFIAGLLDAVDGAIAKTEAIIVKLREMRTGLLHDLLTRGLDKNGQLRDPVAHPEHFQDSLMGLIPKEWSVCGILDFAPADRPPVLTGPFGAQLGQSDFVTEGVPVLRIGNVQAGFLDLSDLQHVTQEKASELARYRVSSGDLLFARQGASTGRNALAESRVDGWLINYHIIRVAVDQNRCEPVVLHALFNSEAVQRQINRDKGRGTREGINTSEIIGLRFPIPPFPEQRVIVAALNAQSQQLDAELLLLSKLTALKRGVVGDLLTGRVRVPESILATEARA